MKRALRAEWTKLRTVPSTAWSIVALVGLTVGLTAFVTSMLDTAGCPPPQTGCDEDTTLNSLSGVYLGQIAAVVLAALAVTAEHSTNMIRTTLAAEPRRAVVLGAKAVVVVGVVVLLGALAVLGSLLVGRMILPGSGFTAANGYPPPSLGNEPTLRAAVGTVLYLALLALLSIGVAATLRHTAAAVTTVLTLLYIPFIVALMLAGTVGGTVQRFAPMTAGLAVQATVERADSVPIGPWAGLCVLAAHAGVAMLVGYIVLRVRDA